MVTEKQLANLRPRPFPRGQIVPGCGRPKGAKNRTTLYRELFSLKINKLNRPDLVRIAKQLGLSTDATVEQLITARHLSIIAKSKDETSLRAIEMAQDSAFGKPVQPTAVMQATVINASELAERIKRLKEQYKSEF